MIIIFSYNRPEWLMEQLQELSFKSRGEHIVVIDDGSSYDPTEHEKYCTYFRTIHRGKIEFYIQWQFALHLAKSTAYTRFIFMPDDIKDLDLNSLFKYYDIFNHEVGKFALNYMRDGIERNWTNIIPRDVKGLTTVYQDKAVDGAFITNRKTLHSLGWKMEKVDPNRFRIDGISSGVGSQLSERLVESGIPIYTPYESLCYHRGWYESEMHTEKRKKDNMRAI